MPASVMTVPPQEWPTRMVGPSWRSSTRFVAATSSASEVSGFWTMRHAVAAGGQFVVDAAPAGAVGEGAVDEDDVADGLVVGMRSAGGLSEGGEAATAAVAARSVVVWGHVCLLFCAITVIAIIVIRLATPRLVKRNNYRDIFFRWTPRGVRRASVAASTHRCRSTSSFATRSIRRAWRSSGLTSPCWTGWG